MHDTYGKYEFEIPTPDNDGFEIFVLEGEAVSSATDVEQSKAETSVADEGKVSSDYMTVFPSGIENIPQDATLLDRLAYGGKITLIGMTTVFLVLIIIWAICALMGKILGSVGNNKPKNSAPKSEDAPAQSVSAPSTSAPAAVDYSMVAVVASAAIAAYRGEDTVNFTISSINPCGNGAVALAPEVVAQIAASIACLEGKDTVDFTISSIRII